MVRTPPPRPLGSAETLESLTHWITTFRTYYKRDDSFKPFLKQNSNWDPSDGNYGLQSETTGLKRSASDMKEDLVDLLNTLAGFLPHSYLTDKILKNTKNWNTVWEIVYEHYGVQVTGETMLDFEDLVKQGGESYRQFFERLLQHSKQHLAPAGVKVEQISTGGETDYMTVSFMNMIALQWLRKINPSLIKIVKTEYSTDLRKNTQLASLVPKIAPNIDSLLERYNAGVTCNKVISLDEYPTSAGSLVVNKVWNKKQQTRNNSKRLGPPQVKDKGHRGSQFCPGCFYLGQQLDTTIHTKHFPTDCPRRQVTVKLLQIEDSETFEDEGNYLSHQSETGTFQFQDSWTNPNNHNPHTGSHPTFNDLSKMVVLDEHLGSNPSKPVSNIMGLHVSDTLSNVNSQPLSLMSAVRRLENRWNSADCGAVRKCKSPAVPVIVNRTPTVAVIDEVSEINCIDEEFAIRANILFIPTTCKAVAAGTNKMKLAGQTMEDCKLFVQNLKKPLQWNLGKAVVVTNLGADILMGEPGKADNRITTIPHRKIIQFLDVNNRKCQLSYYTPKQLPNKSSTCRATTAITLYPKDSFYWKIPSDMSQASHVQIAPKRSNFHTWIKPKILKIREDDTIEITNEGEQLVRLLKNEHFADIRPCITMCEEDLNNPARIRKLYDISDNDLSHLIPMSTESLDSESHISDISIDPDNQLSAYWKKEFRSICEQFSDIITPRPGKYNGYFGRVDNSINFSSKPPPSIKAHLPRYSHDMLTILAKKMDKLENWGVLRKPEDLGVVPEFVVPSMLMPKPEEDEWRLVTDFTPLNIHIKKLETVSPTIQEAKEKLAKFKYHIQLDLSNYFYQGGMRIEDIQYLATPHPFKGLRVYTCEPQGLKNASEHAYERLARIYGDLCMDERMTRMADGLFVLGDTMDQLITNFKEVLHRARLCNIKFKPSKIIIAPVNTILFGWEKVGEGWRPTTHTISPLISAQQPSTVKQMRSWLGSFKQLSNSISNYAVLLSPLEEVVGGRASAERIVWTAELNLAFNKAKESLKDINTVFIPNPSDTLHTFSDYSAIHKAVGGRMEIHRPGENGSVTKLHGGDFSCRVNKHQKNWTPCEGEALAVKMVINHFGPYLRENNSKITHHTDNMPVVQAWKRSKKGAFSSSSRIASFLSGISALDIEITHTPGKDLASSDFSSRHPVTCLVKTMSDM